MAGVEYQVTKVDPTDPETKGMVYQVHKVSEEVAATLGGKVYRARIIKDPTEPTVAGKVYQIVLIDDPDDPAVKGKVYNAILTGGSEAVVVGPAVSPLALDDAIADTMEYVKAYGGTEQRNLPAGYTLYDSLIGDGNAYINLDCVLDQDDEIEIDFMKTSNISSRNVFGGRDSATSNNISVIIAGTGNVVADFNNSDYAPYRVNTSMSQNAMYKVIVNKTGRYVYDASGTLVDSNTTACEDAISAPGCYVFNLAGAGLGSKFVGVVYKCVVKGKRDCVPAYNGTEYGMYDKISGRFFGNANTEGTFSAGNVVVPTPATPIDIISNNGALKARHQSGLPLGYTLLEYINTNGGYLDLNYVFTTNNQKKVIKFKDVAAASGSSSPYAICGTQNGSARTAYLALKTSGKIGLGVGSQGAGASSLEIDNPSVPVTVVIETKSDNSLVFSGGSSSYDTTWSGSVQTGSSEFLGKLNITSGTYSANVDVYEYSLYADGTLVRELVPVRRNSDNELGMYDLVSGQFFTNQGIGDFTAGSTVSDPVEIYTDGTVETINVHGKNLFDKNSVTPGYYYTNTGVYTQSTEAGLSDWMAVSPNTTYTITTELASGSVFGANRRVNYFDSNKNWLSQDVAQIQDGTKVFNITTPSNAKYLRISYPFSGIYALDNNATQIERGSTATDYVPYYDGGTAIAEMLLKVGDYQDVQSIIDGVVTRKVGVKVLDGTEDWTASGNLFYAGIATDALEDTHSCYCTHFKGVATNASASYNNEIKVGTNATQTVNWTRVQMYPVVGTYSSVTVFKQWLADQYAAGTPVIVIYPLATPTTESVTGQTLQVTDGDNVLEITQASIDGLELEAEYEKEA